MAIRWKRARVLGALVTFYETFQISASKTSSTVLHQSQCNLLLCKETFQHVYSARERLKKFLIQQRLQSEGSTPPVLYSKVNHIKLNFLSFFQFNFDFLFRQRLQSRIISFISLKLWQSQNKTETGKGHIYKYPGNT